MIGDWPVTKERVDTRIYSDLDDIFEIERDFPEDYSAVRKVNQLVIKLGEQEGVHTFLIPPPLICRSSRLFNHAVFYDEPMSR